MSDVADVTGWQVLIWAVLPYAALAIFVIGHIWRWRYDQFGWTSYSTQLQEKRMLKWGAPLFHYATFAAIGGHVLGILIPASWIAAVGIPESWYHMLAVVAGNAAAILVIVGVVILATRRMFVPRVRAQTSVVDYVALVLLLAIILTGIIPTMVNIFDPYEYRETVSPWFRGLFVFNPQIDLMVGSPFIYQLHATAAWLIWAVWPFTRLVHAWSYPLWYLWRPFVVFRSRVPKPPAEPGTGGRKWRKIGVPY